jgi:CheY-like chemotaxis protein
MQKILIVDDEDEFRVLMRVLLEREGYQVEEAEDGKKGLDRMRKTRYDLVILDFFMPEMTGREVLEEMTIFVTMANFSPEGEEELRKLGSLDYIRKPFDNNDFLRRIARALKR